MLFLSVLTDPPTKHPLGLHTIQSPAPRDITVPITEHVYTYSNLGIVAELMAVLCIVPV